ncbi:hypothetical protein BC777_1255 [Yoonia maricola]|uniref:Uncharacterized protein n=1 Tax=Yoonia maricola TaxID=420999 RepID=A0A2M8WNG2_9RHOB|nr:hypothetical protein [Yoonia maricola]PJI92406.1 hypothetical protein BC777_1255 [Yoonia maricola]
MKHIIAMAALAFCPTDVVAQDAQTACAETWEDIVVFAGDFGEQIAAATVESGADGWCMVAASLDDDDIEAAFRTDQLVQAPQNARSFEVTIEAFSTCIGVFDIAAMLSYQPETGALRLHQMTARADDGRGVRIDANMRLDDFEAGLDFLATLPAVIAQDAAISVFVTPGLLQEAEVDLSSLSRVALDDALRDVSPRQVDRRARSEFLRFAGATPNAQGTLDLIVEISGGKTVLQIAPALDALRSNAEIADALATVLMDATVGLVWKPGRM